MLCMTRAFNSKPRSAIYTLPLSALARKQTCGLARGAQPTGGGLYCGSAATPPPCCDNHLHALLHLSQQPHPRHTVSQESNLPTEHTVSCALLRAEALHNAPAGGSMSRLTMSPAPKRPCSNARPTRRLPAATLSLSTSGASLGLAHALRHDSRRRVHPPKTPRPRPKSNQEARSSGS